MFGIGMNKIIVSITVYNTILVNTSNKRVYFLYSI